MVTRHVVVVVLVACLVARCSMVSATDAVADAFQGCVFVGHMNSDTDSVGTAMAAAIIFDGVSAIADIDINAETAMAISLVDMEKPQYFPAVHQPNQCVVLVDYNQRTQMGPVVAAAPHIIGIIDHHAIHNSMVTTARAIHVIMRPVGSTATIVTDLVRNDKTLTSKLQESPAAAVLLLCAILSDTLNFTSTTTTTRDSNAATWLQQQTRNAPINDIAKALLDAKTNAVLTTPLNDLVRSDAKMYDVHDYDGVTVRLMVAAIEGGSAVEDLLLQRSAIQKECLSMKRQHDVGFGYVFLADIINKQGVLVPCGGAETCDGKLAMVAFPANSRETPTYQHSTLSESDGHGAVMLVRIHGVSRKLDVTPPLTTAIENRVWAKQCPPPHDGSTVGAE